jgi:RNA polymerase sigma-70 factor (ECF subfamily)
MMATAMARPPGQDDAPASKPTRFPAVAAAPAGPSADRAAAELDRATLERARAADPIALRAFVVRYERPVFALLSRMLGPGPHVEDLAQETFLRAIRALPAFQPDGAARASTWLLTIATRLALDARKRRRFPLAEPEAAHGVPDPATPETERARRELGARLAQAAETLSDDQRAAFVLAELHGFTLAEVARALGIPENTAKTRLFRARERMRAALEKDGESAAPAAARSKPEEG